MRVSGRAQRSIVCWVVVLVMSTSPGFTLQRKGGELGGTPSPSPAPPPSSNYPVINSSTGSYPAGVQRGGFPGNDTAFDVDSRLALEQKRGKLVNIERQRTMEREATQLARVAAELQQSLESGAEGREREEAVRRADTIEKLAHNVKERMKGAR